MLVKNNLNVFDCDDSCVPISFHAMYDTNCVEKICLNEENIIQIVFETKRTNRKTKKAQTNKFSFKH